MVKAHPALCNPETENCIDNRRCDASIMDEFNQDLLLHYIDLSELSNPKDSIQYLVPSLESTKSSIVSTFCLFFGVVLAIIVLRFCSRIVFANLNAALFLEPGSYAHFTESDISLCLLVRDS